MIRKQINTPITDGVILTRSATGQPLTNIDQKVIQHSPDGFEWGYGGSGPADLALNIIESVLLDIRYVGPRQQCFERSCFALAWKLHQDFKWSFIARMPIAGAVIPYQTIIDWIAERNPL